MTDTERFMVTGGAGCIGAWVVRNLIKAGVPTLLFDKSLHMKRLELILSPEELTRINIYQGDIAHFEDVQNAVRENHITHIIHLAALQLPFCKADPVAGAQVNVVGTVNIFEVCKRMGIRNLSYASSTAVYGISEDYPEGKLEHAAKLMPRSHYGFYKQANEGNARVYWMDDNLPSIGLRPYVVYGAGRDQGMTSTPTKAILAAIAGRPYHISYGGRYCFQYADDVAKVFIQAARKVKTGAEVYNIGGKSVSTEQVISAIENELPTIRGKITFSDIPLPFPPEVDNIELEKILGTYPDTPLSIGVRETISIFEQAIIDGRISKSDMDSQLKV
jgi:UDP-glucuronate 4-epimerase